MASQGLPYCSCSRGGRPCSALRIAFFLFLLFQSYRLPDAIALGMGTQLRDLFSLGDSLVTAAFLAWPVGLVGALVVGPVLAWLLANFESRDAVLRKRAVGWLLAVYAALRLWDLVETVTLAFREDIGIPRTLALISLGLFLFLASIIVPLALIYLVRVRHSDALITPPSEQY